MSNEVYFLCFIVKVMACRCKVNCIHSNCKCRRKNQKCNKACACVCCKNPQNTLDQLGLSMESIANKSCLMSCISAVCMLLGISISVYSPFILLNNYLLPMNSKRFASSGRKLLHYFLLLKFLKWQILLHFIINIPVK